MDLKGLLALVIIGGLIIGCLALLWGIVRFAIISPMVARGAKGRLRNPQPTEVEAKWQVKLPSELADFFRQHPIIEKAEFYLAPDISNRDRWLYVYSFIPLTVVDVSEARKCSGVPGIPIALGGEGGTYYLPTVALRGEGSRPVLLRQRRSDTQVAGSVEEFFQYPQTDWRDDEE